jgi:hypothetical protein
MQVALEAKLGKIILKLKPFINTCEPCFNDVMQILHAYQTYTSFLKFKNLTYSKYKKIRMPNFPSEVSEHIVKLILEKRHNLPIIWKPKTGDLADSQGRKLEVKCFSSEGPSSFGPTTQWHRLYFLDATRATDLHFKCYEINLNRNEFASIVKINETQTYQMQCDQGMRPHLTFAKLAPQLGDEQLKLIFDGELTG